MPRATLTATAIVTVALAALLAAGYALGRGLVPDQHPSNAGVTAPGTDPRHANQPPDAPATRPPAPGPSHEAAPDTQTFAPAGDGPYGTLTATGTSGVALTFDDGPDPRWTPQVLTLLAQYGVKATFCVVGENAARHPDLIRAIAAEGHTLCNHSWSHDVDLGQQAPAFIRADMLRTNDAILAAAPHARIAHFRQPGGAWTPAVVSACADLGLVPLHWNVDPSDWRAPGALTIEARIRSQLGPGAVVLLHDAGGDRSGTVEALQQLLPELLGRFDLESLPAHTP
ncbi:polysaccharide deacetylase family protein [Micromonospora sp. DT31]|uniref:polysaccharide deacetylase family protein n=1 Tax=Micromonospora sp. DT31 TaxID=3393434 RepID=UPI003CF53919